VHDFSALVGPRVAYLDDMSTSAKRRPASALENYLLARLDGSRSSPWLDGLEFYPAAKLCEITGAVALFGRTPNLHKLSDADWHAAGGAGFEIASGGEPSFRAFLSHLQATCPRTGSANSGPMAQFGRLYQWLAQWSQSPCFDSLRDLMRRHIVETSPVGPGDEILGQRVERRVLLSIRSASLESGAHPKRLRKLLAAKGLIPEDHRSRLDNEVVFDAKAAQELLALAADGLSLKDLWSHLNAGRVHARLLTEHGFIKPAIAAGEPGIGWHLFAKTEVDAFLARLLAGAMSVTAAAGTACDIPLAAKRAHCGGADVVRLILDRKLDWVGRLTGVRGYLSVLVDSDEVRRKVRGPNFDGLSISMVKTELRATSKVVWALVSAGLLPTKRVVNPANGRRITVVSRADMDAFRSSYVSLSELATERGIGAEEMAAELESTGAKPMLELDKNDVRAAFYRRAEVG
jgi:hypothetical protein